MRLPAFEPSSRVENACAHVHWQCSSTAVCFLASLFQVVRALFNCSLSVRLTASSRTNLTSEPGEIPTSPPFSAIKAISSWNIRRRLLRLSVNGERNRVSMTHLPSESALAD